MTTPPALNGQIFSPNCAQPMGAAPMAAAPPQFIFVPVPGSNLARVGADLVQSLTFTAGAAAVGLVLATAIFPQALKPAHLLGYFSAVQHNTFVEETTRTDADRQRYIDLNHNKTVADTSCAVAAAANSAVYSSGARDFSPLASFLAAFACQSSQNIGQMQRRGY